MEDNASELDRYIKMIKLRWFFWNIVGALLPICIWSVKANGAIDLWSGTLSCSCALAASIYCTIINDQKNLKREVCFFIYVAGIAFLFFLADVKKYDIFNAIVIEWWGITYLIFAAVLFYVLFSTFAGYFEEKARMEARKANEEKQKKTQEAISTIAQKSTDIDVN